MKIIRSLILLLFCLAVGLSVQARDFRSIQPIARPEAVPAGATAVTELQPVPRIKVEQAVQAVARAWNSGELDPLLADGFANKSRLLDTIAEVVPRDARLTVLGIQAVSTLDQYRQEDKVISTVSAVVRSQIEFNDPATGFQRLEGTGEWYFQVEEMEGQDRLFEKRESLRLAAENLHREKVRSFNERLAARESPPAATLRSPPSGFFREAAPDEIFVADILEIERDEDRPYIDEVIPAAPQWDSHITIRGMNFGDTEGSAHVVTRDSRSVIALSVQTWSDRAVGVTIDEIYMDLLPFVTSAEPMVAVVWLEKQNEDRAGMEVVFQPTPSLHSPIITEVISGDPSSSESPTITPGQTLRLIGRNFLSRPGSANFLIGGRNIPAEIADWSETQIDVTLPEAVEGLVGQEGTLTVSSHLGWDGEIAVSFVPRIEWDLIEGAFFITADARLKYQYAVALNHPLANGWVVGGLERGSPYVTYDFHYTEDSLEHFAGIILWVNKLSFCEIYDPERPEWGSSSPSTTIRCRTNVWDRSVGGRVWVTVHGPAGTTHGHVSAWRY